MSDVSTGPVPGSPVPAAGEPARMSPLSRYVNVFFSPGPVFEDIRRDPRGWWMPILIGSLLAALFAGIYFQRFGQLQGEIEASAIKDSDTAKLVMTPEQIDERVQVTLKVAEATPTWQRQVQRIALFPAFSFFSVWFLTCYLAIVSLAMGWLKDLRGWKFVISILLSIVGLFLSFFSEGLPRAFAGAAAARHQEIVSVSPVVVWIGAGISALGAVLLAWILFRSARETGLARIIGAASYACAPLAIGALVGAIIALIKAPDPTPIEQFVPSNLGSLLSMKSGALAALASSLDIFVIWFMILLTIGAARAVNKRPSTMAWVVFTPWVLWVLGKTGMAAIFSTGS